MNSEKSVMHQATVMVFVPVIHGSTVGVGNDLHHSSKKKEFTSTNQIIFNTFEVENVHADESIILPLSLYFTVHISTRRLHRHTMSTDSFTNNLPLSRTKGTENLGR